MAGLIGFTCYTSTVEPKNIKEAIVDEYLIEAMQEESQQFEINDSWELVPKSRTNCDWNQCVYRNKAYEHAKHHKK